MATIVLGGIGAIYGGPVGAAIGAVVGYAIDSELAQQGTREGPRLGALRVQTSRYGSAIPKLFGRTRVSGTVIWSTDLIETRGLQSNGKGKGNTATYSYAASFAVLLSARQVLRIERIWADGNLLRGAAGDFKTATGFRLLTGDADQMQDPLIAAAEGLTTTPAYRGRTVAVFEDFQLAAYGNRVPSLSFEVVADEGSVSVPALIGSLSDGAVTGAGAALIDGIAVTGNSVRSVALALAAALPLSLRETGTGLEAVTGTTPARSLTADDFGTGATGGKPNETRTAALRIPEALALGYYDGARDYQPGVQRARRDGGARRDETIDLAAVIGAGTAKALIEARLSDLWRERRRITVSLPWRAIDLRPGDRVTLPGEDGVWRIAALAFERMEIRLTLVPVIAGSTVARVADAGRSVFQPDLIHGATTLALIDLPPLTDAADSAPRVGVAANGASPGWRGAPLLASNDGGASYTVIGTTALPAVMGQAVGALGPASAALIDQTNRIDVQLRNATIGLSDADGAALLAGANLAMIGGEAVQFGRAAPLGNGRWRLSALWRGRRGTEGSIVGHVADETFVLIDAATLAAVPPDYAIAGLKVRATGIGDGAAGIEAMLSTAGRAVTPLTPAHLGAVRRVDGGFDVRWVRRSRGGWPWRDGVDAPLGEEREAYHVVRTAAGLPVIESTSGEPRWHYSAAQVAADLAGGATSVTLAVSQTGSQRVSAAATMALALI